MTSLRFVLRQLRRHLGHAVTSIVTLGFGIGLVSTQFSLVDGLLLRPLPVPNADRLYHVARAVPGREADTWDPLPLEEFVALREQQTRFDALAAFSDAGFNLSHDGGTPRRLRGVACTSEFLVALGVAPALGQGFQPGDDRPGQPRVVVLSHGAWQEQFGGDPKIVGRPVRLNGEPATIIGVMPRDFRFPGREELWTNLRLEPNAKVAPELQGLGLLKPGGTRPEALAELDAIARRHQQATAPQKTRPPRLNVQRIQLAHHGGGTIQVLQVMLAMTGFVLLLACVNVASLQLNRVAARARELAVRSALGASRIRLFRQLLAESLLVAALGAGVGLVLAAAGVHILRTEIPARVELSSWTQFDLNPRVLALIAGLAVTSGLLAGLLPAWRVARTDLNEALKDEARGSTGLHLGRLGRWLAGGQVAFAGALTIAAILLALCAVRSSRLNLPFAPESLLLGRVELHGPRYDTSEKRIRFYRDLLGEVSAVPGVAAAAASSRDLVNNGVFSRFEIEGAAYSRPEDRPGGWLEVVSQDYFRVVRQGALRGRLFEATDGPATTPVAVVNASFARFHWPDADPIGRRIRRTEPDAKWATIVGVVPDLNMEGLGNKDPGAGWYLLQDQEGWGWLDLVLRAQGDPRGLVPLVRAAVARVDPEQPIHTVVTLADHTRRRIAGLTIVGTMATLFAAAALGLAGIGIYGITSSLVRRRTREFGIRMALGATARGILTLLIRQNALPTLGGIGAGLLLGLALARPFTPFLPQVSSSDPRVFLGAGLVLVLVAFVAVGVPARRASRVDPSVALRAEE